jgi:hypothetical protein
MAFKMKAGKEGPFYKNYGIGKKSPMQKPGDDKKHGTGMLKDPDLWKRLKEEKDKEAYGETGKPATVEPKKEITPQTSKDSFKKKSAEEKRRYKESPMPKNGDDDKYKNKMKKDIGVEGNKEEAPVPPTPPTPDSVPESKVPKKKQREQYKKYKSGKPEQKGRQVAKIGTAFPKNSPMQGSGKTYAGGDQGERYEGEDEFKKQERRDAKARVRMIDRKYPDMDARRKANLALSSKYRGYTAKDEAKEVKDQMAKSGKEGIWGMMSTARDMNKKK